MHTVVKGPSAQATSLRITSKFVLAKFQVYHHSRGTHLHKRAGVCAENFGNDHITLQKVPESYLCGSGNN